MRVLFVSSGNHGDRPGSIVYNQAKSLLKEGIDIKFFLIKGKGSIGYLKNVRLLISHLKKNSFDVVHSHYSFSAFVVTLALIFTPNVPHVVSLMGSDVQKKGISKLLIVLLSARIWRTTIVKTSSMSSNLDLKKGVIIPNGVNVSEIVDLEETFFKQVRFNTDKPHRIILFAADPKRIEKNFQLARASVMLINKNGQQSVQLKVVHHVSHERIIFEILNADILLLTSLWEGSPNIIKEAMVCNCPIVATDVGDVKWLFGDEKGYYLTSFDPEDVAEKLTQALEFSTSYGKTNGRTRIHKLELDSGLVAKRIINLYKEIL